MLNYNNLPTDIYTHTLSNIEVMKSEILKVLDTNRFLYSILVATCDAQLKLIGLYIETNREILPLEIRSTVLLANADHVGKSYVDLYMDFCNDMVLPCFDVTSMMISCKRDNNRKFYDYLMSNFHGCDFIVDPEWEEDFRSYVWEAYLGKAPEVGVN